MCSALGAAADKRVAVCGGAVSAVNALVSPPTGFTDNPLMSTSLGAGASRGVAGTSVSVTALDAFIVF